MTAASSLGHRLVGFCRLLREHDLAVTPAATLDAARSLELVDVSDAVAFHAALRANFTVSASQHEAFDEAFAAYWGRWLNDRSPPDLGEPPRGESHATTEPAPAVAYAPAPVRVQGFDAEGEATIAGGFRSAGESDGLMNKDFAHLKAAEAVRARRLIQQLAPSLATVPGRRWLPSASGSVIDVRRTVNAARRHAGEVIHLARQERRQRKLRVVALCDVSGSMDTYSGYLLQFLHALQGSSSGVRTFVFGTRLQDVTAVLRRKRFEALAEGLSASTGAWGGGTTIGACLRQFNAEYAARLVGPRTVVMIVSDGWERGDANALAREVAALHRRAYRVVWLNPLKGRDGYEPLAAGMAAALPHIDHFLPANSIEALEQLKKTLASL